MKSEKNFKKSIIKLFKENKIIILFLLSFFIIKVYFITSRYHMPIWDEAVYIGMGKYIYSTGVSGLWEIIRPYGLPLIIGALWRIGLDPVYSSQIVAILFSCATIFMTYLVAKELFDKKVALLSALFLMITPVFFLYSIYALTEIPSTFFVLLAIYLYIKDRHFLSGLTTGVAMLFRFPQGLVLVPILLAIVTDWFFDKKNGGERINKKNMIKNKKTSKNKFITYFITLKKNHILFSNGTLNRFLKTIKKLSVYFMGFLIIIVPFLTMNYIAYNKYTSKATDAIFRPLILAAPHQENIFESVGGKTLPGQLYNIFYYIIMMINNNMIFLLSIAGAIMLIKKYKEKSKILFLTFFIYIAYYSYIINKQERFIITFLPIICIITAYTIFRIIKNIIPEKIEHIKNYKSLNNVMLRAALVSLIIIALIITSIKPISKDIEYYYWLHKNDQKPKIIEEYYSLINTLGIKGPVLISEPVIGAFINNKLLEYNYVDGKIIPANDWESYDDIEAITYVENTIPCIEEDSSCKDKRDALLYYFISRYDTYYKGNFYGYDTYLFIKKK